MMMPKNIDWKAMYKHLSDTKQLIEENAMCSAEQSQKILRQRANELAKELVITKEKEEGVEIIEFILGDERYGIESIYVNRVLEAKNITTLPAVPKFIEGIINLHGDIICIVNLKEFFGLQKITSNDLRRILIVNHDDIKLGILADAVKQIGSVILDSMQTSLPTLTGIRSEFLQGITQDQRIILNVPKLLTHKGFILNDSI